MALRRPRLLVVRALGLGDLLTAVPALRALARAFADHERILAAPAALAPLVALIDADGRAAIERVADVGELEPLPVWLHGVEVAVNLHGRGPESHGIVAAAAPQRAIWFEHPGVPAGRGAPQWRPGEPETARWCRLLTEHGIAADPRDLVLPAPGPVPAWARDATLIHPGAASRARRWPPERFAAVAEAENGRGARVAITGSPAERALAETVAAAAGMPSGCVQAGRTGLAELARAVAGAGRLVSGDTGVAHLATAFGTPSVTLFGPTPPSEWGPPPGLGPHIALWAGRRGDPHAFEPDPGLLELTVADVLGALQVLPAPVRSRRRARRPAGVWPPRAREGSNHEC